MSIIKVFYSEDKKSRVYIHRRKDGLIDILVSELEQDYYVDDSGQIVRMDDYYWYCDGVTDFITDSVEIAEKEILRELGDKYIEAPIVDVFYHVSLADGREGEIVDITADGDYIVRIEDDGIEECISIQDIKEAHDCE